MMLIANGLVAVVAALHVYFLVLEMFLWTRPLGLKTFRNTIEKATETAVLAANQGLYNGFLAAGLIWSLRAAAPFNRQLAIFFLGCVLVAGLVGFLTIMPPNYKVLIAQSLSAALALLAVWKIGLR